MDKVPFRYVARVLERKGDKVILELGGDTSVFHIEEGDEFITLTTPNEMFPEQRG